MVNYSIYKFTMIYHVYNSILKDRIAFTKIQPGLKAMMTTISAKLTKAEIDYLTEIARDNHLYKGDSDEPSTGKAMKELVKWCRMSGLKMGENKGNKPDESQRMLEQIHAVLPQMMYHLRMQVLFNGETLSDEILATCKQSAINFLNSSCGEFQAVKYQTITPAEDDNGLNKLPVDKDHSKWKSKKI